VHIITVNDYLATRDASWMRPVYEALGLTVGIITHELTPAQRQQAYACDVTYCTNKELVFDYLKDRLAFGRKPGDLQASLRKLQQGSPARQLLLRGLPFAIIDEADSVLIDEARTPLVISGQGDSTYEGQVYRQAVELAGQLCEGEDFTVAANQVVNLTEGGQQHIARLVDGLESVWSGRRRREELVSQALNALHLFHRDRDYLVRDGKVQIVDEFTGRILSDRSWERGLHQMVEAKEGCRLTAQKDTLARISYQRFFRRYHRLAGMTGTAQEVAGELWSVYGLRVVRVPTNRPAQRRILPGRLYAHREQKWQAVVARIVEVHAQGRPLLIGTRSVEASEYLSEMLSAQGVPHRILNARQDQDEAEIVGQAGQRGQVTVATNMAGRGTDIKLGPGVAELGGLCVVATEPHAARRIDRQLFGRCGRQGDPGSCELFASLEDELLFPLCGPGKPLAAAARAAVARGTDTWLGRRLLRLAQQRIERRHFQMRAELLHFDEMMEQTLAFSGRRE
jgi:preprotein translocase subunit SecA